MLRTLLNVLRKRPILAIFDVTKRCNQRCAFCNIWKTESDDMDISAIAETAAKLRRFGIGYVFIQGGEPTLRKDLIEIIDIFINNGIKPTVISNGLLMTDAVASEIAARKCNLAISIDSLKREDFAAIRGVDALEKVMDNVRSISKFKEHKGNWAITTTVTAKTTMDDVLALKSFADEMGFMYAIRPYIFVKGTAGKKNDEMTYRENKSREQILEIFDLFLRLARRDNYLASLVYEEHIKYIRGKPMKMCDALRYSFLLKENGKIAPCIEFPDREIDIGSHKKERMAFKGEQCACNSGTPCFYNDAREIGIIWRKKWRILLNFPRIIKQMIKYGNFF